MMELKLKIDFQELLALVAQMSVTERNALRKVLEMDDEKESSQGHNLEGLMLKAPVMSNDQYEAFSSFKETV